MNKNLYNCIHELLNVFEVSAFSSTRTCYNRCTNGLLYLADHGFDYDYDYDYILGRDSTADN